MKSIHDTCEPSEKSLLKLIEPIHHSPFCFMRMGATAQAGDMLLASVPTCLLILKTRRIFLLVWAFSPPISEDAVSRRHFFLVWELCPASGENAVGLFFGKTRKLQCKNISLHFIYNYFCSYKSGGEVISKHWKMNGSW